MNDFHCSKCGKQLGGIYYTIDDQPWCSECYLRFQQSVNLPSGWVCPKCGRVNAPHINQCPCSLAEERINSGINQKRLGL